MKIYIWRHNRRFHSYSMMDEPCIHHGMYTDAVAVVMAESQEEALKLLAEESREWCIEDIRQLTPTVIDLDRPQVLHTYISGN
ncbi:MAG: hypothetical protein FH756_20595 [Firmicutes bacterium]|nr:hypothetical protein [Bacillota bacterium]